MLQWWSRFRPATHHYVWRHPVDHISSTWLETVEGAHVESIRRVEEPFASRPMAQLLIQFRDPPELFPPQAYDQGIENSGYSQTSLNAIARKLNEARKDSGLQDTG